MCQTHVTIQPLTGVSDISYHTACNRCVTSHHTACNRRVSDIGNKQSSTESNTSQSTVCNRKVSFTNQHSVCKRRADFMENTHTPKPPKKQVSGTNDHTATTYQLSQLPVCYPVIPANKSPFLLFLLNEAKTVI